MSGRDHNSPSLDHVPAEVRRLSTSLPRFADGRIDYTQAQESVVLDCYVLRDRRLLVLKRTRAIGGLPDQWHVISGYLDQCISLREMALQELFEEAGIRQIDVVRMIALPPYTQRDEKQWTVFPIVAVIQAEVVIRLNEEHSTYCWIELSEANAYLLPQVAAPLTEGAVDRGQP